MLDMAPTVAAFGKVRLKMQRGEEMPVGWMIGRDGKPLTDPRRADEGFLASDRGLQGLWLEPDHRASRRDAQCGGVRARRRRFRQGTGQARPIPAMPLSRSRSRPSRRRQQFKRQVDGAIRAMRGAERLPGVERIWLPGEQSHFKRPTAARTACPCPSRCARPRRHRARSRHRAAAVSKPAVGLVGLGLSGRRRWRAACFMPATRCVGLRRRSRQECAGWRSSAAVPRPVRRRSRRALRSVVLAVFSTDQVETVVERELLPALGDGSGQNRALCASTCDPDRIALMGARVATRGLRLLETPGFRRERPGEPRRRRRADRRRSSMSSPQWSRSCARCLRPTSISARSGTAGAPSSRSI